MITLNSCGSSHRRKMSSIIEICVFVSQQACSVPNGHQRQPEHPGQTIVSSQRAYMSAQRRLNLPIQMEEKSQYFLN